MAASPTGLSRERVLRAAIAVADAGGLGSLTIRSLATELAVKPMSVPTTSPARTPSSTASWT